MGVGDRGKMEREVDKESEGEIESEIEGGRESEIRGWEREGRREREEKGVGGRDGNKRGEGEVRRDHRYLSASDLLFTGLSWHKSCIQKSI